MIQAQEARPVNTPDIQARAARAVSVPDMRAQILDDFLHILQLLGREEGVVQQP